MTKEELYIKMERALRPVTRDTELATDLLDEFFSEHVCIKKGANRHPYADVLHEWLEGAEIEVKLNGEWADYMCSLDYITRYEYRIKPQEPVYEALVRINFKDGTYEDTSKYFTLEEFKEYGFPSSCEWVESTKRERKQ